MRMVMVLVILFHAYQASQGEFDVHVWRDLSPGGVVLGNIDALLPIFFVLGGFALYYQFGSYVLAGRPLPGSREWLVKRAVRLLPVYFVVFLVVWVWRYGGGASQWEDLAWGLTLMQTWSTEHIFRTIDPGWYLSIEWHFALVTAFVVMPWLRVIASWPPRSRLAGLLVPPLAFGALTIWWRGELVSHKVPGDAWGAWFAPPSWALMYGFGMLLGLALVLWPADRWRLPRPAPLLIFSLATAGIVQLQLWRGEHRFPSLWFFYLTMIGVTLWMVAAITADPAGRVRRFLRSRPVQLIAASSFATYIVHAPVLRSLDARGILPMNDPGMWPASAAAIVILSLGLGYLVHRYVEGPLSSIEKVLVPKVARVSKVVKVRKATIAVGQQLPDVEVATVDGASAPLRHLGGGRPVLLLVHPAGIVPRHPALQGAGGALRVLDGMRAAAPGLGIALATLSPPAPSGPAGPTGERAAGDPSLEPIVQLVDPASAVATAIGVGTVKTSGGAQLPELVLLAVDGDGRVVDVVRERDPHTMVRRAVMTAERLPAPRRRFARDGAARPSGTANAPA